MTNRILAKIRLCAAGGGTWAHGFAPVALVDAQRRQRPSAWPGPVLSCVLLRRRGLSENEGGWLKLGRNGNFIRAMNGYCARKAVLGSENCVLAVT